MGKLSIWSTLRRFLKRIARHLWGLPPYYRRNRFVTDLAAAQDLREQEIGFVADGDQLKWAVLVCPCGCGDTISVNLMTTQYPSWSVKFENDASVSIRPSLWVTQDRCGSHFVLTKGRVEWCNRSTVES